MAERPPAPPLGLPLAPWPKNNPYSPAKAALGRLLFFDTRLSSDGTVACASCHDPRRAFSDRTALSEGIGKQKGVRNAMAIINRGYGRRQLWDSRAASLEEQVKAPLADTKEMTTADDPAEAHRLCIDRLRQIPGYRERFRKVFGAPDFTVEHVGKAIATFERTIYSGNSPYDRYRTGDVAAMTPAQVRGMELFFGKPSCMACHNPPLFTDEIPANTGVGSESRKKAKPDLGVAEITGNEWDRGFFRTPTLRDVALTAPYMHDGSVKTLEEAVEHYDRGGGRNPRLDDRLQPLHLTKQEKKDLVSFLKALSGEGWQHIRPPAAAEMPR